MLNKSLNFIGKLGSLWGDTLLTLLLLSCFILFLGVKSWSNTCFFLLLLPSLYYIKRSYSYTLQSREKVQLLFIFFAFALPIIATFISQLSRQDWLFRSYDSPSRFLFSILIFFYFTYKRINFSFLLGLTAPLALFITIGNIYFHPEVLLKWPGRLATSFVDPNTFGTYSLVLTSFCLFHLDTSFKTSKLWFFYQLTGFLVGLLLIIGSGTRGSWLAIPAVAFIWLFFNRNKINSSFIYIAITTLIISIVGSSIFFPQTIERFLSGINEISHWLDNTALDSSTGLRLSIWKISWQLFIHQPFFGYGNQGYVSFLNEPWFSSTATTAAKQIMICCGPHNELISSTLRAGLLGGFSVLGLFLIPSFLFVKNAFSQIPEIARASQIGLAFIACVAISSISMEVFHLKYTATFYGLMLAGLTAQIFSHKIELQSY